MSTSPFFDRQMIYLGALPLAVSTAVVSVVPTSIPPGASGMVIAVNSGAGVNWLPKQDPTATFGMPLLLGDIHCIEHEDISDMRFIRQSTDSVLTILFVAAKSIPE